MPLLTGIRGRVLTHDLQWMCGGESAPGSTILGLDASVGGEVGQFRRMYRPATIEGIDVVMTPCFEIDLENGETLMSAWNQEWLVGTGLTSVWRSPSHMRPGFTRIIQPLDTWRPERTYEAGYLAAALDGEGWLSQTTPTGKNGHKFGMSFVLGFAQRSNEMFSEFTKEVERRGLSYRVCKNGTVNKLAFGKPRRDIIKLIGTVRPRRLLGSIKLELGMVDLRRTVKALRVTKVGDCEVLRVHTSTGAFVLDGFATKWGR